MDLSGILYSILNFLSEFWFTCPTVAKIGILLSLLFILIITVIFFIILISRIRISRHLRKKKIITQKVKNALSIIIAMEEDIFDQADPEAVRQSIINYLAEEQLHYKHKLSRQILIDEILLIQKELAGSTAEHLRQLYFSLKLDRDSSKKLRSWDWQHKATAIHELAQMKVEKASKRLLKYTNHPNPHLRIEAQMGYILLHPQEPFNFLAEVEEDMSEWHQLNLLATISKNKEIQIPLFKTWLNSENDTVISFCLKMIAHYNQLDAIEELLVFIHHLDSKVRCNVIYALQKLEAEECVHLLLAMFPTELPDVQVAILNNLIAMRSEEAKPFLQRCLSHPNFNYALLAAQALANYPEYGQTLLREILPESDERLQSIIKHALDTRI